MLRKSLKIFEKTVPIKFRSFEGETKVIAATAGVSIMQNARLHRVELESSCDGTCACSTCHVHISPELHSSLPAIKEDEADMLDTAAHRVVNRSRLACQVVVTEAMRDALVDIPGE